jgi:hypothetical protein
MGLLQRIAAEKRTILLPVVIGLLVNVGIAALAVYPLRAKVAAAEQRARLARQALNAAEAAHTRALGMVQGKDRASEELKRFYSTVLPTDLTGARRITYLRLAQLAERADLRYERRTVTTDQPPESPLARLRMTMVLAGDYENVRRFIHQLETSPEFVVIEDVALAQAEEGEAPLVLTLALSTYYWTGANGT